MIRQDDISEESGDMYVENSPKNLLDYTKKYIEADDKRKGYSNNSIEVNLKFVFPTIGYDENLTFDYFQVISDCPLVQRMGKVENNEVKFNLPNWIAPNEVMEYLYICKNGFEDINCMKTLTWVFLKISEYFENFEFSHILINEVFLKSDRIEKSNCYQFLEISYEKLNFLSENSLSANPVWFELFYSALDFMSKNIFYFLANEIGVMEKVKNLNKKIAEELVEKSFSMLILNNCTLRRDQREIIRSNGDEPEDFEERKTAPANLTSPSIHSSQMGSSTTTHNNNSIKMADFERLINFSSKIRNSDNIFDLLINEYMMVSSEESIHELENLPNPIFQLNIPMNMNNYYNEFPLDLGMGKTVTFIIYYRKSDDSLNVSFKLNNNMRNSQIPNGLRENIQNINEDCFNIFTFLSVVSIDDDRIKNQINVRSAIPNIKSSYPIFRVNNLKQILQNKNKHNTSNFIGQSRATEDANEDANDELNEDISESAANSVVYDFYKSCHSKVKKINNQSTTKQTKNPHSGENFNTCNNFDFYKYEPKDPSFISNYSHSQMNKVRESINLKINFRFCFNHTAIVSFILKQFRKFYNLPNINKFSTHLLKILLKNKLLDKESEDQLVVALINWLNDEININEDITDILENIDWKSVSVDLTFEFVIKHFKIIETNELQHMFLEKIIEKLEVDNGKGNCELIRLLILNLFNASKKVNYTNIFLENKKIAKINFMHLQDALNSKNNKNFKSMTSSEFNGGLSFAQGIGNMYLSTNGNKDSLDTSLINLNGNNAKTSSLNNYLKETNAMKNTNKNKRQNSYNNFTKLNQRSINSDLNTLTKNQNSNGFSRNKSGFIKNQVSTPNAHNRSVNLLHSGVKKITNIKVISKKANNNNNKNIITTTPQLHSQNNNTLKQTTPLKMSSSKTSFITTNKFSKVKPKTKSLHQNSLNELLYTSPAANSTQNSKIKNQKFIYKAKFKDKVNLSKYDVEMGNRFIEKMLNISLNKSSSKSPSHKLTIGNGDYTNTNPNWASTNNLYKNFK